jgi:hypothetical protein
VQTGIVQTVSRIACLEAFSSKSLFRMDVAESIRAAGSPSLKRTVKLEQFARPYIRLAKFLSNSELVAHSIIYNVGTPREQT